MYIDSSGRKWYKGNLHTHTSVSDGKLTPGEVTALYLAAGYDFIALTDHWKWGEEYDAGGLLVVSGCEYHTGADVRGGIYHIVCAGAPRRPALEAVKTSPGAKDGGTGKTVYPPAQEIIDGIKAAGGYAVLAHPAWSLNEPCEVLKLRGLDAIEIYNTVSGPPWNGRPYSGFIADRLASCGMTLGLVAVDDAHFYNGDACRSNVWVNAERLDSEAVFEAMRAGLFYSTQGPRFSHELAGGILTVHCDPAREVRFLSDAVYVPDRISRGMELTEASYKLKKNETFVRFEVEDDAGRVGWSNIIRW